MTYLLAAMLLLLSYHLYRRYFPVCDVPCTDLTKHGNVIVDIRDYSSSAKNPINGAITIPFAYLNRYNHEIPSKEVHLVASDSLEKNVGIRYLRKKGFRVVGYTLTDCHCEKAM